MDFIFINLITAKAIRTPPQIIERILYKVSFSIFKIIIKIKEHFKKKIINKLKNKF